MRSLSRAQSMLVLGSDLILLSHQRTLSLSKIRLGICFQNEANLRLTCKLCKTECYRSGISGLASELFLSKSCISDSP